MRATDTCDVLLPPPVWPSPAHRVTEQTGHRETRHLGPRAGERSWEV